MDGSLSHLRPSFKKEPKVLSQTKNPLRNQTQNRSGTKEVSFVERKGEGKERSGKGSTNAEGRC